MDVREIRRVLIGKLSAYEDRARHHVFYFLRYDGKDYRGPKLSHSWRGDLDDQQIDWIKRPLLLSKAELENLVECPLSGEEFYVIWAQRKGLG